MLACDEVRVPSGPQRLSQEGGRDRCPALAGVLGVPRRAGLGSATLIRFGRRAAPGEPLTLKKQEEETKEKKKKDAGQGRWGGADSQRLGCEEIDEE